MIQGRLKRIRKDHYAGALMVVVGVGAFYFGWPLKLGTLMNMGPGYFPLAVATILVLLGVAIAVTAGENDTGAVVMDVPGEPADVLAAAHAAAHKLPAKPEWRGWSCILLSFTAFIVLLEFFGMIVAVTGMTLIACYAERGNSIKAAVLLAIGLNAIFVVVFWWALQMPFRLFWWS